MRENIWNSSTFCEWVVCQGEADCTDPDETAAEGANLTLKYEQIAVSAKVVSAAQIFWRENVWNFSTFYNREWYTFKAKQTRADPDETAAEKTNLTLECEQIEASAKVVSAAPNFSEGKYMKVLDFL